MALLVVMLRHSLVVGLQVQGRSTSSSTSGAECLKLGYRAYPTRANENTKTTRLDSLRNDNDSPSLRYGGYNIMAVLYRAVVNLNYIILVYRLGKSVTAASQRKLNYRTVFDFVAIEFVLRHCAANLADYGSFS